MECVRISLMKIAVEVSRVNFGGSKAALRVKEMQNSSVI